MPEHLVELSAIYIYPVKSLRGMRLDEAPLEQGRLAGDRTWLLVDEHGAFMHQRDYPRMTRMQATPTANGLVVTGAGMPPLEVARPTRGPADRVHHVRLWRRRAPVMHASREADDWFTRALGVRCQLMAFVSDVAALEVPSYEARSTLQDATPFHLTNEASLADLNARMAAPIPMNRFRPNLVIRGADPYAEDGWKTVAIGETTLRWIKACTRCVATTTDQETGERASRDPLMTLARYRRLGNEVVFGHYLVADTWGERLRVGDPVRVVAEARGGTRATA